MSSIFPTPSDNVAKILASAKQVVMDAGKHFVFDQHPDTPSVFSIAMDISKAMDLCLLLGGVPASYRNHELLHRILGQLHSNGNPFYSLSQEGITEAVAELLKGDHDKWEDYDAK